MGRHKPPKTPLEMIIWGLLFVVAGIWVVEDPYRARIGLRAKTPVVKWVGRGVGAVLIIAGIRYVIIGFKDAKED